MVVLTVSERLNSDAYGIFGGDYYPGVYVTYNPFPLVLLTDQPSGSQAIYIAPNAHEIASTLFDGEVKFWEKDLGRPLEEVGIFCFNCALLFHADHW